MLRRHRLEDLPHVRRWYRDPELARLTRYSLQPMSDDEIDRFFHGRLMSPETVAYAIDLREGDRLIGLTTFSNLDPDNGSVLFHISIGEHDAWGRGYGTEATELMLAAGLRAHRPAPRRPVGLQLQRARHPQLPARPASGSRVARARPSRATASASTS